MLKKGFKRMVAEANAAITTVTPEDALSMVDQDNVVFLDVREPGELQENGKLAGAVHAPRGMLEFQADPDSPYHNADIDGSKKIVVYCATGGRSALSAKTLVDMGFENVCHIAGGFNAWKEAGNPVN
jgi:rhodanese-related sulfurtransferase